MTFHFPWAVRQLTAEANSVIANMGIRQEKNPRKGTTGLQLTVLMLSLKYHRKPPLMNLPLGGICGLPQKTWRWQIIFVCRSAK